LPTTQVDTVLTHGQRPCTSIHWPPRALGGTPLAEALRFVLTEMVSLTEPRKIVVILTDGDPNDHLACMMALKEAADLKIEVVTLGIEDVRHPDIFPSFEIVSNVRDLPEKAFRLLEKLLLQ
jgi:cobaltochelatase CobT